MVGGGVSEYRGILKYGSFKDTGRVKEFFSSGNEMTSLLVFVLKWAQIAQVRES